MLGVPILRLKKVGCRGNLWEVCGLNFLLLMEDFPHIPHELDDYPLKYLSIESSSEPKNNMETTEELVQELYDERCPVCLEKLSNKALLNNCLHQFCLTCITKWSNVSKQCPLCKETFEKAIHSIEASGYFETHLFEPPISASNAGASRTVINSLNRQNRRWGNEEPSNAVEYQRALNQRRY